MKLGTLCYIERDQRVLMLHRVKKENDIHQGLWVGLGGKVEPGESPDECVVREVYEESGLTVLNPQLRAILTFPGFADGPQDWMVFLYSATEFTGELKVCDEGDLAWIDRDKLDDLAMHEGDRHFLRSMQQYRMFSAKLTYDGEKLLDYQLVLYAYS